MHIKIPGIKKLELIGRWNIFKGHSKEFIARFSNHRLAFLYGKKERLIGAFQKRTARILP